MIEILFRRKTNVSVKMKLSYMASRHKLVSDLHTMIIKNLGFGNLEGATDRIA